MSAGMSASWNEVEQRPGIDLHQQVQAIEFKLERLQLERQDSNVSILSQGTVDTFGSHASMFERIIDDIERNQKQDNEPLNQAYLDEMVVF